MKRVPGGKSKAQIDAMFEQGDEDFLQVLAKKALKADALTNRRSKRPK